jgi:hypothetical protein
MSNTIHISTADVKGTIDPRGGEYMKGTLVNSEGNFETAVIQFSLFEVVISPTTKSFQELYSEYRERSEVFGNIEPVEFSAHHVLYKELRGFAGRKKETYVLLWLKTGKTKNYLLEGKGRLLEPVSTEADARKALEVIRTFEPAD